MRPLNMMLAGGGGDVGDTKSGRRGIEACKEKLKEGLRASDLRRVVVDAAANVADPSHWRGAAPLFKRCGRRGCLFSSWRSFNLAFWPLLMVVALVDVVAWIAVHIDYLCFLL